jgi:UDP-2,3-diacylglucosamine hydrolase
MNRQSEKGRLAIIAGSGTLPLRVAEAARLAGDDPLIIALSGEANAEWSGFDHVSLGLGDIARFDRIARQHGVSRVVMSGGVSRRPLLGEIRLNLATWLKLPSALKKLVSGGDNTVLTMAVDLLETAERKIIGVQDIAPGLLATLGPVGAITPDGQGLADIKAAATAASAIGHLDMGQGAVAVGGRVVALEGPEGTDAMLARVADLKRSGRISAKRRGVLVKLCKPNQDDRVDLPSVGLSTVRNALAAGLSGIALEAGRALLLDRAEVIALANGNGLFVTGIEADHAGRGHQ